MVPPRPDELQPPHALLHEAEPLVEADGRRLSPNTLNVTLVAPCWTPHRRAMRMSSVPKPRPRRSRATETPRTRTCGEAGCASESRPRLPTRRSASVATRKMDVLLSDAASMRCRQSRAVNCPGCSSRVTSGSAAISSSSRAMPLASPGFADLIAASRPSFRRTRRSPLRMATARRPLERRRTSASLLELELARLLDRGLRRGEAGDGQAEGRAAHVVHPGPVAELDGLRVAAVLAADAHLEVARASRGPSRCRSRRAGPRPPGRGSRTGRPARSPPSGTAGGTCRRRRATRRSAICVRSLVPKLKNSAVSAIWSAVSAARGISIIVPTR